MIAERNRVANEDLLDFSGDPQDFAVKTITWLQIIGYPSAAFELGIILQENG